MNETTPGMIFIDILNKKRPDALAWVRGNDDNPQLSGLVKFYKTPYEGILIEAEIFGLPNIRTPKSSDFYAMHIHENGDCSMPSAFGHTGSHYTKDVDYHPQHNGDLLPIMGNQGYAWSTFYDKRLTIEDVIGRSVVIHNMPDDFRTQPAGNSGEKIACGVIR